MILKNKHFYLSGPIEFGQNSCINWRDYPKLSLEKRFGIHVFDPFADPKQQWKEKIIEAKTNKDYDCIVKIAKSFVQKDLTMVQRCDALIAYLPYKVPTIGTHHEIIQNIQLDKPTLLVCEEGVENLPVWYFGLIPLNYMFGSWDSLFYYLGEINSGEKHLEDHRWDFVRGLL